MISHFSFAFDGFGFSMGGLNSVPATGARIQSFLDIGCSFWYSVSHSSQKKTVNF